MSDSVDNSDNGVYTNKTLVLGESSDIHAIIMECSFGW